MPPQPRLAISRRRVLRGALGASLGSLALVAGCTPNATNDREHRAARREARREARRRARAADPDVALATAVLVEELALLARIEATLAQFTGLAGVLGPVQEVHQAHVSLLEDAVPGRPSTAGVPSGSSGATASASPEVGRTVPRDRRGALVALARGEDELAVVGKRSAFAAESGAFARVLAGMAAAAAQQATVLRTRTGAGAS